MDKVPHIAVVGGGLAGLLLAAIAGERCREKLTVTVIERVIPGAPSASLDTRATAISRGSKGLLDAWGLWGALAEEAKPIEDIHVSRTARFGSTHLRDTGRDSDPMGWVVENQDLQRELLNTCAAVGVDIMEGRDVAALSTRKTHTELTLDSGDKIEADAVIIADGAESSLRQALGIDAVRHDTHQVAIAVNCETDGADNGIAYERFTDQGPLALLPIPNGGSSRPRYNVIWCAHPEQQATLMSLSDDDFIAALQETFGWRVGKITRVGRRSSWPLRRVVARELVRDRCLLLGNSAHTLHPVAGQGFNLSVRDVGRLERLVVAEMQEMQPFSSIARLSDYARWSHRDHQQTTTMTSLLAGTLDAPSMLVDVGASMALSVLDLLPPAKRAVAEFGMGKR